MAINTIGIYIYDSNLELSKQGSLTWEGDIGLSFTFSEESAIFEKGEVGVSRLAFAVPLATFSGGTPLVIYRRRDGYTSSMLTMTTANWAITEDAVETTYQVFYIDLSVVGWTYSAGLHATQCGYLYSTGDYEPLPLVYYTVSDGVNDFAEITADEYQEISTALHDQYADLLDRLATIETYAANSFNYDGIAATGIDRITFYNETGTAVISYDGTNLLLNRDSVDEEIMTVLNELGDLSNVVITSAANDNLIVNNGTNWVNITKTAFLSAVNARIDTNVSDIADRELISNKVNEVVSGGTTDQYVNAAALYTKFLTKVDKAFTIAGLDMQSGSITLGALKTAIGEATTSDNGLLSATDKTLIDVLRASYSDDDGNSLVDTIKEVLTAFDGFPESTDLMAYFATKVDKVAGKELSENDLTDELKTQYDDAVVHANTTDGTNPHLTTYANLVSKPTTFEGFGLANGSVETIEATTSVTTPKIYLATGVYIQYNSTDDSIDFIIE